MRRLACLLLLTALAAAQEKEAKEERTLKDGVLTDPYWSLTLKAPGLKEAPYSLGGQNVIFEGNAGDLKVQILVYEVNEAWKPEEWRTRLRAVWTEQQKRKLEEVEEGEDAAASILYVHESLAGFRRHHGHAFYPRGYRCFEIHAEANEKSDTSAAALKAVLRGLTLGKEKGNSLAQVVLGKRMGKEPEDPEVLLAAADAYVKQQSFPVAVPVLERAAALANLGHYDAAQQYFIHEYCGLSILSEPLRDAERALPWHLKAEEIAKGIDGMQESAGVSAYNVACAYSLLGKADEGFAALRRAFAFKADVVSPDHLASDPDLDNLRKDPRWAEFAKERGSAPVPAPPTPPDESK